MGQIVFVVGEKTPALFLKCIEQPLGHARLVSKLYQEAHEERTPCFLKISRKPLLKNALLLMGAVSYERVTPVGFRVEVDRSEDSVHVGAISLALKPLAW